MNEPQNEWIFDAEIEKLSKAGDGICAEMYIYVGDKGESRD